MAVAVSSVCVLLFVGFAVENDTRAAQAPLLFFVLPVALGGITLGLRGGLLTAVGASALMFSGSDLSLLGHASRALVLVLVGAAVGVFADERRRLIGEIDRQHGLSLDLIGVASFDGFFTQVNPAWTRELGYSEEELLGRPFLEFFHPDDRDATAAAAAKLVESGGKLVAFENRMCRADGAPRWVEWTVQADTGARSFVIVGRDVTARKEAEERDRLRERELALALEDARETNLRLNLVAEAVLDGLITVDEHGTVLRFNSSAERIYGYGREEVIGRNVGVLSADKRPEGYVARYVRTGEEGIIGVRHEHLGRRKDGSVFPVELTLGEVAHRGTRNFIGVVRDLTEHRQREEAALEYKEVLERTVQERTAELRERSEELEEARLETLRKLARAAEYRDDQTFKHAERVGTTAALLGEQLGLAEVEVQRLRQAAPLHDIGKLAVSDTILLKRGKLTLEEWQQMRSHTTVGHEILSGGTSDVLSLAAEIALSHHEWWDGSGYPAGLEGEQIPLSGRIVGLADVFDSLCHERSYKPAWTVERAAAEIHRLSGLQFDPAVADAFSRLDPRQLAGSPPPQASASARDAA